MIQSGSSRRSSDAMEAIWTSLMPKSGLVESFNEDEDVTKLSLLLKSTQLLLTGLRQKKLCAVQDVKILKDELQAVRRKKEQVEVDSKNLQQELLKVKFELQTVETKSKKFQKDAESATLKWQQLQSRISSEIENRLNTMFKACLQQNKAVTVLDMMTQMHQETDLQATECPSAEQPAAKVPRVADLAGKQTVQSKTSTGHKISGENLLDKSVIFATPDRGSVFQREKTGKKDLAKPRHLAQIITSASSSPDEIAPTPPSANEKHESKKRARKRNCFKSNVEETSMEVKKEAKVYVAETQDVTQIAPHDKLTVLKEIVIPETLNPEDCAEEVIHLPSTKRNKENGSGLSGAAHLRNSPTKTKNMKSCCTPEKSPRSREQSPVFGSENKKNGARPSNTSLCSSAKKPRFKGSSFQEIDLDVSYRRTESGRMKKSVQPHITSAFLNMSKTNLSKSNKSKSLSLNKTQQDISKQDIQHLSEAEQIELALSNSRLENYSNCPDDSDATLFLPISPAPTTEKTVRDNTKCAVNSNKSVGSRDSMKDSANYFEPMFASTEKQDVTPTKWKETPNRCEETLQTQFNPPLASTEKPSDFKVPLPTSEKQSGFRPAFASTQKDPMENSALKDFVDLLEEEEEENNAPGPAESSYDHVPRNYVNRGKKKTERRNLPALECTQCGRYFAAAFGNDDNARKFIVNHCSRHRDRTGAGPRTKTPPGFWNPGWNSPQDANKPLHT